MAQNPNGTLAERYERGTRLRKKTPREKHADLRGSANRDPVAILAVADRTRVQRLVPERYKRMLESPFAFLRGAAAVMAEDLRHQPNAGIPVQACGDCHLMNFGAFATPGAEHRLRHQRFRRDAARRRLHRGPQAAGGERRGRCAGGESLEEAGADDRGHDGARPIVSENARRSPSARRWRSGTARSIWRERSSASRIAALRRELFDIISKTRGRHRRRRQLSASGRRARQPRIEDRPPLHLSFHGKARREGSDRPGTGVLRPTWVAWHPSGSASSSDTISRIRRSRSSASAASARSAPSACS